MVASSSSDGGSEDDHPDDGDGLMSSVSPISRSRRPRRCPLNEQLPDAPSTRWEGRASHDGRAGELDDDGWNHLPNHTDFIVRHHPREVTTSARGKQRKKQILANPRELLERMQTDQERRQSDLFSKQQEQELLFKRDGFCFINRR